MNKSLLAGGILSALISSLCYAEPVQDSYVWVMPDGRQVPMSRQPAWGGGYRPWGPMPEVETPAMELEYLRQRDHVAFHALYLFQAHQTAPAVLESLELQHDIDGEGDLGAERFLR